MDLTRRNIATALEAHPKAALAFSGGTDSLVLLDILAGMGIKLPLIFADSQMEYPEMVQFVKDMAARYQMQLYICVGDRTPLEQWTNYGWPILGKLPARYWMVAHQNRKMGFRLDVTGCCRNMKINPGRRLTRKLGIEMQFTGIRGAADDRSRAIQERTRGNLYWQKQDKLWISNPLTGWTDTMTRSYVKELDLPINPIKAAGATVVGCRFCFGAAKFRTTSGPFLRRYDYPTWYSWIVEMGAGAVFLAVKYDQPLPQMKRIIERGGGLHKLATERPWIFDYLKEEPLAGYEK